MRTNIEIDDELMKQAMEVSGAATKKAAVEQALEMLVKIKNQEGIREWFGKVEWEGDLKWARSKDKWAGPATAPRKPTKSPKADSLASRTSKRPAA